MHRGEGTHEHAGPPPARSTETPVHGSHAREHRIKDVAPRELDNMCTRRVTERACCGARQRQVTERACCGGHSQTTPRAVEPTDKLHRTSLRLRRQIRALGPPEVPTGWGEEAGDAPSRCGAGSGHPKPLSSRPPLDAEEEREGRHPKPLEPAALGC